MVSGVGNSKDRARLSYIAADRVRFPPGSDNFTCGSLRSNEVYVSWSEPRPSSTYE